MASPFSVFRSNLKPLMVALTLLSLFAFVVLPAIQMYQQSTLPGAVDLTVATYRGGQFDTDEIAYYQRLHAQTNRFLAALSEQVVARGGTPNVPNYGPNSNRQMTYGISISNSPQTAVLTKLFAERASELGLELDDTAIKIWLDEFTNGRLTANEVAGIRAQSTQNSLGQSQMYGLLRTELLANLYERMLASGLTTGRDLVISPLVSWQNFLKLNQEAKATAYPVLVEEYLEKTGDPSAATVEALYAEGKDKFPNPDDPTPAFRKPYAADIRYVAAHLEDFIAREIEQITEEQLLAEYDRRVKGGDFLRPAEDIGSELDAALDQLGTDAPGSADNPDNVNSPDNADAPAEDGTAEPAADNAPASDTESSTPPAEPADAEPAAADPAPADPATGDQPVPAEPNAGDGGDDGEQTDQPIEPPTGEETPASGDGAPLSDLGRDDFSGVRLVNVRQEDGQSDAPSPAVTEQQPAEQQSAEQEPAEQQPAEQQPAEQEPAEQQPAEQQPAEQQPAEQQPAEQQPAEQQPAEPNAGAADDPAADSPAQDPSATDPAANDATADTEPAAPEQPAGPKPFDEVKDEIARDLATPKAQTAFNDAISQAYDTMKSYFTDLTVWEATREGDRPLPPDLDALAKQLGLRVESTGLKTALDVYQTTLGRARMGARGMETFTQTMYNSERPLFYAVRAENQGVEGRVAFSAWKTEEREAYIPELSDIREEVVAAAKLVEARQLAQKAAADLAQTANANPDKSLTDIVPETRKTLVFEDLGPFPWYISLGYGYNPFLGQVPELDNVGEEFMRAVFNGPIGQYEVASNNPETVYYVVKATEITPAAEELRPRFMQANQRAMTASLAVDDLRAIREGEAKRFEEDIDLQWNEEALRQ
jgi:hypothetical protein